MFTSRNAINVQFKALPDIDNRINVILVVFVNHIVHFKYFPYVTAFGIHFKRLNLRCSEYLT